MVANMFCSQLEKLLSLGVYCYEIIFKNVMDNIEEKSYGARVAGVAIIPRVVVRLRL